MKPKKGWARPDRPGAWGQRRDGLRDTDVKEQRAKAFGLRKMKSEAILRHRVSQDDVLPGQGL